MTHSTDFLDINFLDIDFCMANKHKQKNRLCSQLPKNQNFYFPKYRDFKIWKIKMFNFRNL